MGTQYIADDLQAFITRQVALCVVVVLEEIDIPDYERTGFLHTMHMTENDQ